MKVLFITSYYPPAVEWGGPATCVPAMAAGLKKLGIDLTVATTNARALPNLPRVPSGPRQVGGVPVYYFDHIGPARYFLSFGMMRYLWRHLKTFDLIHIQGLWSFPSLLGSRLSRLRGRPYVITLHGLLVPWAMSQKSLKKRLYWTLFEEKTLRHSRRVHFTSEFEKNHSAREIPEGKSVVIPNPIDIEEFLRIEPLPLDRSGRKKTVLAIIGRLHPVKGFDLLLPALARLREAGDFELVMAGPDEGNYLSRIRALIDSLALADKVRYLGFLQGRLLAEVYEKADIVVVPSYQENFGMAAAEGMASARPVVLSSRVGVADIVTRYEAGWVFEPSVDALAGLLRSVLDRQGVLRARGLNGRRAAQENFSERAVATKLAGVYGDVLGRKPL